MGTFLKKTSRNIAENVRKFSASNPSERVCYPFNLTLDNLYYFMFAPTLCYELNFPRTPSRRKSFIIKRIVEVRKE
jgi:diacylglycerol O-acyltransferase-1